MLSALPDTRITCIECLEETLPLFSRSRAGMRSTGQLVKTGRQRPGSDMTDILCLNVHFVLWRHQEEGTSREDHEGDIPTQPISDLEVMAIWWVYIQLGTIGWISNSWWWFTTVFPVEEEIHWYRLFMNFIYKNRFSIATTWTEWFIEFFTFLGNFFVVLKWCKVISNILNWKNCLFFGTFDLCDDYNFVALNY